MPPSDAAPPTEVPALTPQRLGRIRTLLLHWYDEHEQPFPWRNARDPYLALVAAVCAQQTQIARAIQIYERWTAAFPTIETAASASRAEILRVWDRAGYPRRAVNLHEATRICVDQHHGQLPRDHTQLLSLPGIGPFTAAIVASFGFGDDAAAVDTNIIRVIGRLICGHLQPATDTPRATIDALAQLLLRPGTADRWNPTLMDYGGRVCTPRPHCNQCVVAHLCAARPRFAAGETSEPVRAQGKFTGSDRDWRGRLMQSLRDRLATGAPPLRTTTLINSLTDHPATRRRLHTLLKSLVTDGLATTTKAHTTLGSN